MDDDIRERVAGLYLGIMLLTEQLGERDPTLAAGLDGLIAAALSKMSPEERASEYGRVLSDMRGMLAGAREIAETPPVPLSRRE